jgi:hypothetical protein
MYLSTGISLALAAMSSGGNGDADDAMNRSAGGAGGLQTGRSGSRRRGALPAARNGDGRIWCKRFGLLAFPFARA